MSREHRKALKLRVGALTLVLAGVIIGSTLTRGDFQCQACKNLNCKMVNAYGQLKYDQKTMTWNPIAAWSFWTVAIDPVTGLQVFTAAQNASGGGGFQACQGDQGGAPKKADPLVNMKKYQFKAGDTWFFTCPSPQGMFAEALTNPGCTPAQHAVLGDLQQYVCSVS